jgi:hypothetical protein
MDDEELHDLDDVLEEANAARSKKSKLRDENWKNLRVNEKQ